MKRFLQLAMVVGLLFASRPASAAVGYVCTLNYETSPDYGYGKYGGIVLTLTAGVNCSGTRSTGVLLSQGATTSPDTRYHYSEAALLNAHTSLLAALATGIKTEAFISSNGWQVYGLRFWKN